MILQLVGCFLAGSQTAKPQDSSLKKPSLEIWGA